jgi:hypothetical protein
MVAHGSSPQAPPVQLRADVATLAEMLVRPESFFPKLVAVRGKRFPFVAIWIVGAGAAVDRLDSRMLLENFRSTIGADRPNPVLADWTATWASVIVGGLIGGLLIWLVLGWWYRMRLKLCGARPPKRAARNVFIHANLIVGVVAWGWILVFLWSVWISYRGVVSCFDVRPVAALVWFLILPWLVYTGLMALLFTIGVLSAL